MVSGCDKLVPGGPVSSIKFEPRKYLGDPIFCSYIARSNCAATLRKIEHLLETFLALAAGVLEA